MKHKLIKVLSLMMALTMLMGSLVLTVGATDCAHENMDVVSEVAATCTTWGHTISECADCGYQAITTTDKVAHEYATVPAVAPTCSVAGNVEYQGCVHCGKPETGTEEDYADPATGNHDWELFVDEPGTGFVAKDENGNDYYNTTDGRLYKRCTMCAREEVIEVFEQPYWGESAHNFVFTITQEPTCITNGYATYSCAHCNQKWENIYVAPNATYGHSFTKDLALNSTCKSESAKSYVVKVCAYCDMPEETLPTDVYACNWVKLAANDQWTLDNDVEFEMYKDCLTDGYIVLVCSRTDCGEHMVYTPTSDDANWFAYYADFGTHEGHKKTAPQSGNSATSYCSYSVCDECEEEFPIKAAHNWATEADKNTAGLYTVNTPPTCYTKGTATVKCKDCNATKTVSIKATGHKIDLYECPVCTTEANGNAACTDCTHANRTVRCSNDGCTQAATAVAKKEAHDKVGTIVEVPATCLTTGYKNQVCSQLGCTVSEKVAGSDTAIDEDYHYNFVVRDGSFTWAEAESNTDATYHSQYKCENAVFAWTCACTGGEKVLDLYNDYDFLKANVKNPTTLAEVKGEIGAAYFTGTGNAETLKAKDTFKGKGHAEFTTFKPKTNLSSIAVALTDTDFFGAAARVSTSETDILAGVTFTFNLGTTDDTSDDVTVNLSATTATCGEYGSTAGMTCVRCGEMRVEPTLIQKNPDNHKKQNGSYRDGITIINYTPATCVVAEAIEFDCSCGAEDVKLTGNKATGNHFWYTYVTGYDASTAPGETTAAKITALTGANYITKRYDNRQFNKYVAPTCTTAGNHANFYCALCKTNYAVTNDASLTNDLTTDPSTWETLEKVAKGATNICKIAGCTCKAADGDNDYKVVTTIPVAIPAQTHDNVLKKYGQDTWFAKVTTTEKENCFYDFTGEYVYCTKCAEARDFEGQTGDNAYMKAIKEAAIIKAHGTKYWVYTPSSEPTCTKNGMFENQYCSKCEKYYKGATPTTIPTDIEYNNNPNPNPTIAASNIKTNKDDVTKFTSGHQMSTPVYYTLNDGVWVKGTTAAVAPTCTNAFFATAYCTSPVCDAFNAFVDLDKDNHVDIAGNEVSFYLNNYYAADDHVYYENDLPADYDYTKAPASTGVVTYTVTENGATQTKTSNVWFEWTSSNTCERVGKFYVKCTATGCTATHVVATIAAVGHKDWQGNALAVNCANAGKKCNECSTTIAETCVNKVEVVVKEATCEEDGITLYVCTLCNKEYGVNGESLKDLSEAEYDAATKTNKINHSVVTVFTESYVEPTLQNEGSIKILCANCGEVVCKLDKLTDNDIYYTVVPYNPEVGVLPIGTTVPQGGMFKITLMMNSGMVYNTMTLDIELPEGLELVDYEFKLESDPLLAVKNSLASLDEAYANNIRIMSTVTGSDKANVVIDGERVVFAELYVKALAIRDYDFEDAFDDSEISGLKVDEAGNQSAIASAEFVKDYSYIIAASKLFDASNNNVVDQGDMIAIVGDLVAGVLGEEVTYNAAADIDRDGKITINDLQYLEKYLLTNQTFADYINVYLMAMSAGKVTLADKIAATDISAYDVDGDGKFGTIADAKKFAEIINEVLVEADVSNYYLVEVEYLVDNFGALYEAITSPRR